MKRDRLVQALLIFLLLICAPMARAQEKQEPRPPRYRMELVWIADGRDDKHEYVFVVGAVGFKTVKGLKDFVAGLPAGSILEWSPGCRRMGDEPLLSSAEELEEFKRFCEEHGVEFILHPSG
jgi:hypothetical protein